MKKWIIAVGFAFVVSTLNAKDGLVAHYTFDGDARDSSGNGHDLLNNGGAGVYVAGHDGISGSAYKCNGTYAARLQIDPAFEIARAFSYSLWFKTSVTMSSHGESGTGWNPGNDLIHCGFSVYKYDGVGLRVGTDGIAVVEHGDCYRPTVLCHNVELGEDWHHVVVAVSENSGVNLYLDGNWVGKAEVRSSSKGRGVKGFHVGEEGIGGGMWGLYTGAMDDMRIYNRALTAAEVKSLFAKKSAKEVKSSVAKGKAVQKKGPATPKRVTLLKQITRPIKLNGKAVGKKPFPEGTVLDVVSVKGDTLKLKSGSDVFTCKKSFTDYDKRLNDLKMSEELGDIKADNAKRFERILEDEQRVAELRAELDSQKGGTMTLAEFKKARPAQPVAVKVVAKITTVYTGMFKDRKGEYLSFALKGADQPSSAVLGYGYVEKESSVGKKLVAEAGDFKEHKLTLELSVSEDAGDDGAFIIEDILDEDRDKTTRAEIKRLEAEIRFLKGE